MNSDFLPRFAAIDLTTQKSKIIEFNENEFKEYIGGRGLAVYAYTKHISENNLWDLSPLDPNVPMIFSAGPLVGTRYPTAYRCNLTSLSPLTNTISSSNMGGRFSSVLKRTGYDGLFITGKLPSLSYMHFNGEFSVHPADNLKGLSVVETEKILSEKYPRSAIASIGPAGENMVYFASITHNYENEFGRGGLGAVMGSKNIKAIVIERSDNYKFAVYDPDGMRKHAEKLRNVTKNSKLFLEYNKLGTGFFGPYYKSIGGTTIDNFRKSEHSRLPQLYGVNIENYKVKHSSCSGCVVACRHHYNINDQIVLTPEFETVNMLGSNIEQFNPEIVLPLTEYVTHLGLDGVSTGHVLAVLKEMGKLENFSKEQLFDVVNQISSGKIARKGAYEFAKSNNIGEIVPQVKGMGFAVYDPRAVKGQGLGYGVSSRGACHLKGGGTIGVEVLKTPIGVSPSTWSGKGKLVSFGTKVTTLIDTIGTCIHDYHVYISLMIVGKLTPDLIRKPFVSLFPSIALPMVSTKPMSIAIKYITGYKLSNSELFSVASRILTLERLYNNSRGFSSKDDILPERFFVEGTTHNKALNKNTYLRELKNYYKSMGWNKEGIPTDATISKLNLGFMTK